MNLQLLKNGVFVVVFLMLVHAWIGESSAQGESQSATDEKEIRFFVSPEGNDAWSGRYKKPNGSKTDGPVATPEGALQALRKLRAKGPIESPVEIQFREGLYLIPTTLTLTAEDSGSSLAPVTFMAFPGERAILSGGRKIPGWVRSRLGKEIGREVWMTELPDVKNGKWYFKQLFVNGKRLPRTRLPETGYYHFTSLVESTGEHTWSEGVMAAGFNPGDLQNWKNLKDVEIVALTRWIESRSPIESLDLDKHIVNFAKKSVFRLEDSRTSGKFSQYWVENVFEALKESHQWYLDRNEGMLYFIPEKGETPGSVHAIAPALSQLVRLEGTSEKAVHDIHFKDLVFRHTEWELPADKAGSPQAAVDVPGAVYLASASQCSLVDCVVEQVGTYGIEVGPGCRNIQVLACTLQDLGGGGVKVGQGSSHATIADCEIAHGGRIFPSAVGVWIGNSGDNQVIHNHIHDLFYTGISVGWTWGYGPSDAVRNIVEYNHIHDIGQGMLSDMGGIYTLGVSPGSRLAYNLIHDVSAYSYGGWGIYPDEGTSNMLIENNVVYHTKTGGFHQHYGKENIVRNNIFALAREEQIIRSREEDHKSFDFTNNIVYFTDGKLLGSNWSNNNFFMDKNLYWNPDKSKIDFKGDSFEEWKERGHDKGSRIADPKFKDPGKGDFTLEEDSPAFKLGFKAIDLAQVGPRRKN